MYARAPASSANLGPGFDALAVALELYVEVTVEEADEFSIVSTGEGAGRFDDERHLAARVARDVLGHDRFALSVASEIPLARGLGSSAALAVAAAAAAGSVDALAVASRVDGHPENAAAIVLGGLVAAGYEGDEVVARPAGPRPRLAVRHRGARRRARDRRGARRAAVRGALRRRGGQPQRPGAA